MDGLCGKTAIICGGGKEKSIGYGISSAFAREGYDLVLVGTNKGKLKAAKELEDLHGIRVMTAFVPNPDEESIRKAVCKVINEFARVDVLVNCALVAKATMIDALSVAEFEETMHTCVSVPLLWMNACRPYLAKSGGVVINLVSESAFEGMPALGALAAASGAMRGLCHVARSEWAEEGIGVEIMSAEARTSQFEKWSSEFSDACEIEMDGSSLASVDEVGALCVALVNEHVASMQ